MYDTITVKEGAPAWMHAADMAERIHVQLIGAVQCKNHLVAALATWGDEMDKELREDITAALYRLTRVGI